MRAAESIPSNIVEGCAAATDKEFARYLDIAIKSTAETEYRLQLALDNGVLDRRSWRTLTTEVVEIRKMSSALRRTVLSGGGEKLRTTKGPNPVGSDATERPTRAPNSD